VSKSVVVLGFDFLENFGAPKPSEPDLPRERAFQVGRQRLTLAEKVPRALDLIAETVAEVGGGFAGKKIRLRDVKTAEIDLGDVDPVLAEVDRDVLPKVGELEGGADMVGKFGELLFPVAVEEEDEAADRVGAAPAVIEHGGEVLVASLDDVLLEGAEEIKKKGVG
jgi:hypothetical protein